MVVVDVVLFCSFTFGFLPKLPKLVSLPSKAVTSCYPKVA